MINTSRTGMECLEQGNLAQNHPGDEFDVSTETTATISWENMVCIGCATGCSLFESLDIPSVG